MHGRAEGARDNVGAVCSSRSSELISTVQYKHHEEVVVCTSTRAYAETLTGRLGVS